MRTRTGALSAFHTADYQVQGNKMYLWTWWDILTAYYPPVDSCLTLSTEVFAQQTTVRYPVDSDLPSG